MISQLMAFAAAVSLVVLIAAYVFLSISSYGITILKEWQRMAIFWSTLLAIVFIGLYIAMSWPDNGKPPAYRYVPVQEQLYRFERIGNSPDSTFTIKPK